MKNMKNFKTILLIALCLVCLKGIAQHEFSTKAKGTYFTNGSVLINSTTHKVNDDKANSFAVKFNPKMGYFIIENLAIGAEIALSTSKDTQNIGFGDIKNTTFGIGILPLARYYYKNFFGEVAFGIATQKTKSENTALGTKTEFNATNYGARIGAGYAFHLSQSVAIEPSVNYSFEKINPKDAPSNYKESLSSIFLGIGISAYF